MALGMAARDGKWLKNLLDDMLGMPTPSRLLCDNTSTIWIATDSASNKRTKHSDREFFITNQLLRNGIAMLEWIPTAEMRADAMTKSLGLVEHQHLTRLILFGGGSG
ncbi:hypothetical protein O181_028400 [Austropuccinia psidii MF-1]|uniref:Integrase catalytic domain-containing protein n=1 Tax=Austropuccinia psidii MF-1 TaxID=1389203 RepID=A0A9Q3CSM4_9BASI|nr:hypothetical protein [Austropuccinia psidii MF-1]